MSPLRIESRSLTTGKWTEMLESTPQYPHLTFESNNQGGQRTLYRVFCAVDDSYSVVKRLPRGLNLETARTMDIVQGAIEHVLRRGDAPFRMSLRTDDNPAPKIIRFTHI